MRRSKEEGEKKLEELRELITGQQRTENELNIAKRKAEREATDQRALCLGYVHLLLLSSSSLSICRKLDAD